ncbi:MAG: DNA polymerase III subunit alpha, partial [Flavobacteriales bacterium]|nr:DNA polymerase III subunit alpha [Flavobacteriales bacterium]
NSIIENRKEERYTSLFDFSRKVNLKDCNKRVFESLAIGGAFDEFGLNRSQYFAVDEKGRTVLETAIRYGNAYQDGENSSQVSLFGEESEVDLPEPIIPDAEEWPIMDKLNREKELVGIYISGHPLDDFDLELKHLCSAGGLKLLEDQEAVKNKDLNFGGMLSEVQHRTTKTGKPFGMFNLEDYEHTERFFLFGEDYVRFKNHLNNGWFIYLSGRVQPRKFSKTGDELEFKINHIELLSDVREKQAKRIKLRVDLSLLNESNVEQFAELTQKYPGPCSVQIVIKDLEASITMPSKTQKVELSREFINELEDMKIFNYEILTR